jgi:hypothetical protein
MGEKKMNFTAFFICQFVTEPSYTGAGIHDNNIAAFGADFETSRFAAILEVFFSGNRYRTPGPPACNNHI